MPERRRRPVSTAAAWGLRLGLFAFCAFPLYWMLVSSLKASHELLASPPTFWPHEWELRAYRKLFYETNFWRYFENTILVSAMTTVIVIVAGVIGAYSLTRYAYRGRTLVARLTLLAYMFPPIIMLVPLFLLARELGLTNSRPGLALTYISPRRWRMSSCRWRCRGSSPPPSSRSSWPGTTSSSHWCSSGTTS